MVTKYDLLLIKFSRDGANWTILQRSKHYSASRMFLREKPESVRFMIIVTDSRSESSREIIKVTRDVTEATLLSKMARAPIELVPRLGWTKHLASQPIMPLVLPTPQRQKKPLIVEVVDAENDKVVGVAYAENDKVVGVVNAENDKVPQECVSKADVEHVTEAPPQHQPQHQPQQSTDV